MFVFLAFKNKCIYATRENVDSRVEQALQYLQRQNGGKFDIRTRRPKILLRHCTVARCVTG